MPKPDADRMEKALNAVNGGMSTRAAATLFGVARTTLNNRMNGHSDIIGHPTKLSKATEKVVVNLLTTCNKTGFRLNRRQTLDIIESFLKEKKQTNSFKNDRPSEDWYYDFIKRNNELNTIISSNTPSIDRATSANRRQTSADPEQLRAFFEKMSSVYSEKSFHENPSHIFVVNEIGFVCEQGKFSAVSRRSDRYAAASNEKIFFSVLICCSASGHFLPPHAVYKGKRLRLQWNQTDKDEMQFGCTPSGWMDSQSFFEWFV